MSFASINAGKLLPYQDYLLYKPSGSLRTKEYFLQRSDSVNDNDCHDELSMATVDEESGTTAVNSDASCLPSALADISSVFENITQCSSKSTLHNVPRTKPQDGHIFDPSSDSPSKLSSSLHLTADGADEVAEMSGSHTDYERMSAENRKRVSEFFSHSRLHHISTWGAEYKAYVMQLQAQVSAGMVHVLVEVSAGMMHVLVEVGADMIHALVEVSAGVMHVLVEVGAGMIHALVELSAGVMHVLVEVGAGMIHALVEVSAGVMHVLVEHVLVEVSAGVRSVPV